MFGFPAVSLVGEMFTRQSDAVKLRLRYSFDLILFL